MDPQRVTANATQHRNITIPSSIFYNDSKEYNVIVDSAFGQAEMRIAFGQVIELTDSDADSDTSEDNPRNSTKSTQDSDKTVEKTISSEGEGQDWVRTGLESAKRKKKSSWPDFIDGSTFLTRCSQNYICEESMCNELNKKLVLRLMKWKQLLLSLVTGVKRKYPFGEESCKEQLVMVKSLTHICNSIAGSGLPLHLMGARQIVKRLDYPETIQEAELVEDMAEFQHFELTAHMSPCHTTFFVVTSYRRHDTNKHVIYGVFPRYQPKEPCPIELMYLNSTKRKNKNESSG